MLFDYGRAETDTAANDVVPMGLSLLGEGGKSKEGKGDKKGKGKGKGRKAKTIKIRKIRTKAKGRTTSKPQSTLLDTAFTAKYGDI